MATTSASLSSGYEIHDRSLQGMTIARALDGSQGALEIAAIDLIVADVAVLPRPNLGEEIVRVPLQMILLPVVHELLQRCEAKFSIESLAERSVGIGPGDVDAGESAQALFRRP